MILLRSGCTRQIQDDVLNVMQLTKTVTWWPATFLLVSFPICPCTSWTFLQVCIVVLHGYLQLHGLYDRTASDDVLSDGGGTALGGTDRSWMIGCHRNGSIACRFPRKKKGDKMRLPVTEISILLV